VSQTCPVCAKRRGKRRCPGLARSRWAGKSETICAPCCGEQREQTIDCPLDCPYLLAAHRYEAERPTAPPAELAFPGVTLDPDFLDEHQQFIAALALFFCRFAADEKDVRDADLLAALDALARGYQTLESGLYYEQPPDGGTARALYAAVRGFLEQYSQQQQQERGASLRPGEVLRALVFLRRLGQRESNGRPLARRFLNFLRAQLPAEALAAPSSSPPLIVPGR
jgi:hypothetical protein